MSLQTPTVFRYPEAIVFWIVYVWVFVPEGRLIRASMPDSAK